MIWPANLFSFTKPRHLPRWKPRFSRKVGMIELSARDCINDPATKGLEVKLSEGIIEYITKACATHEYLKRTETMNKAVAKNLRLCAAAFHRLVQTMDRDEVPHRTVKIRDSIFCVELECECAEDLDCTCGSEETQVGFWFSALVEGEWEDYEYEQEMCVLTEKAGVLTLCLCREHQ